MSASSSSYTPCDQVNPTRTVYRSNVCEPGRRVRGCRYKHTPTYPPNPYKNTSVGLEVDFQNNPFIRMYECHQKSRNNQSCVKDGDLWYTTTSGEMRNDSIYPNPYVYPRNPYYDFRLRGVGVPYVTSKYR